MKILKNILGPDFDMTLTRGAGVTFVVNCGGLLLQVVLQLAFARLMGVAAYGEYSYALSWLVLIALLATLGLDSALLRFLSSYRARAEWSKLRGLLVFGYGAGMACGIGAGVLLVIALKSIFSGITP